MSKAVEASAELAELCINAIRILSMDAVQKAESGHPGTPMALAPLGYLLWTRHLKHDPKQPEWPNRDRFVLSCGHASMLLYSLLHLSGYDLTLEDLENFRQWDSRTPGHPEVGHTPGVETTTGPLGQGLGNAVGMALAEAHLAATFNREDAQAVDHRTWFIASDGDLMEGVSHEAASLAGHLGLGKLIGFYDSNRITIEGSTELAFSEDVQKRFESYGWHVQRVEDVNHLDEVDSAIQSAIDTTDRPSLIIVRSHIAYGSPNKVDTAEAHGAPLGQDEVELTRKKLGWESEAAFEIPQTVLDEWRKCIERGAQYRADDEESLASYQNKYPRQAVELRRRLSAALPDDWERAIPDFKDFGDSEATRKISGKVLNALSGAVPELLGGSADLAPSNNSLISDSDDFARSQWQARNLRFGVREHGMGASLNGMALHGGVIPYGATFLVFSDYMRPAIRLAALMGLRVIYIFTHDSIGLGEDGPTHQPIETLSALRAIPNLHVLRPGSAFETAVAWKAALQRTEGPTALALTRQKLPALDHGSTQEENVQRGGYVLREASTTPKVILMASGSEVHRIVEASRELEADGVPTRVVSLPCHEQFAAQPESYRSQVLPAGVPRLAVEAAHPMSWYRWVGDKGEVLGLERFGASAPYEKIFEEFGLGVASIVRRARRLVRS